MAGFPIYKKIASTVTIKKKRRYRARAKPNTSLVKRVVKLERENKPELKEIQITNGNTPTYVGQIVGNSPGYFSADFTPIAAQSVFLSGRIGSKIRIKRILAHLQFIAEPSVTTPMNLKVCFIRVKGAPLGSTTVVNDIWRPNPFIFNAGVNAGIIDYNSMMDTDYARNFQILKTRHIKIPMETYANAVLVKSIKMRMNFKNPLALNYDGNTTNIASGQIICAIFSDSGNYSATVGSTLTGVPATGINTGLIFNYNLMHYYYDE